MSETPPLPNPPDPREPVDPPALPDLSAPRSFRHTLAELPPAVFLIGCMLAGMAVTLILRAIFIAPHLATAPSAPPAMRGFALLPGAVTAEGCAQLAAGRANWIMLALSGDPTNPEDTASLVQAMQAAHAGKLNVALVVKISAVAGTTRSLPISFINKAAAFAATQADMLVLMPATADDEDLGDDTEAQWTSVIAAAKKTFAGKTAYISTVDSYPAVTWWQQADYIGIAGPFALSAQMPPTRHALDVGWSAHLAVLESLSRREGRPALLVNIVYPAAASAARDPSPPPPPPPPSAPPSAPPPAPPSSALPSSGPPTGAADTTAQSLCYESALYSTRGKPWLEGVFLAPADNMSTTLSSLLEQSTTAWKP